MQQSLPGYDGVPFPLSPLPLRDPGNATRSIGLNVDEAYALIEKLTTVSISMKEFPNQLQIDSVRLFGDSFEKTRKGIKAKWSSSAC